MDKDKPLDVYGISRYLAISPDTVRKLVKRNQIPYYRAGKRIFSTQSYLDQWIQKQIKESTEATDAK
ncbi:DNA binding domain-containing protein, excisionase family [Paenibacillus sp. 1_12]|uniref:helix-turn-helix domain-containing protein n=1 Tax=Paenibacillus sp. 1_12 TaxID=1566278 RepID=UPI0008E171B5|nr:helix-turn-helix domain-containing protein [Paenibacillus sp. 1_12]SFM12215.1 DNA binding domain-containing protein, excisionase family [Paenibacillus sp. 1_12]